MARKSAETLIREKIKAYQAEGVTTGRRRVAKNIAYDFQRDTFYVTFNYGVQKGNAIKETKTFPTAKLALVALTLFAAEKQQCELVLPDSKTFAEYYGIWLEESCKQTASTRKFYQNIIDVHFKPPELGRMKLQAITAADIQYVVSFIILSSFLRNDGISSLSLW